MTTAVCPAKLSPARRAPRSRAGRGCPRLRVAAARPSRLKAALATAPVWRPVALADGARGEVDEANRSVPRAGEQRAIVRAQRDRGGANRRASSAAAACARRGRPWGRSNAGHDPPAVARDEHRGRVRGRSAAGSAERLTALRVEALDGRARRPARAARTASGRRPRSATSVADPARVQPRERASRADIQHLRWLAADRQARTVAVEGHARPERSCRGSSAGGRAAVGSRASKPAQPAVAAQHRERASGAGEADRPPAGCRPGSNTPIAAGLLSSAASRLPRVCAVSAQRDALAREQQREVEVVRGQRLGAEALRVGGGRLVARLVALVERDDAGDHGERPAATPTPARPGRRRRWARRSARRPASRKARSVGSSSASCSAAQSSAAASRAPR